MPVAPLKSPTVLLPRNFSAFCIETVLNCAVIFPQHDFATGGSYGEPIQMKIVGGRIKVAVGVCK
jgi:hypothetical protein